MSFVGVTKNVGKLKSPLFIGYSWFWLFDYFIFERLITIALDKWIHFKKISMDLILFIYLYLRNTKKIAIGTFI